MTYFMTVVLLFLFLPFSQSLNLTEEPSLRLPRLFHLDNYDRCLLQKQGVYCVGKFQIYTDFEPNPTFNFIQEYSQEETNYNRNFLHRGYCLNTRCQFTEREPNVTFQFERCVDQWARKHSLRTRLHTLHYCHTKDDVYMSRPLDTPRLLYLYAIGFILLMNVVGTIYDVFVHDNASEKEKTKKNELLLAWSMIGNWNSYVAKYQSKDPRLSTLQALDASRVLVAFLTVFMHMNLVENKTYHFEAEDNEKWLRSPFAVTFQAITTTAQLYILSLSFLTTLSMLIESEKNQHSFKSLPKSILKKLVRIWPLNFFGVATAATWWPDMGDGPLWPVLVGSESDVCRRKFWAQIFFFQNHFRLHENCLVPLWVLAVQAQLFVFLPVLIVVLLKCRQLNLRSLSFFYVAAVILTFLTVYISEYKTVPQMSTPETLMSLLDHDKTFKYFYNRPVSSLVMCVAGMILAYVHYTVPLNPEKSKYKMIYNLQSIFWVPLAFFWASMFYFLKKYPDPFENAVIMVLDRVVVSVIIGTGFFSTLRTTAYGFLNWDGWRFLTRILFGVVVIHWQIGLFFVARKRTLFETTLINTVIHGITTWTIALILALPLTILVDFPLQKLLNKLINKLPLIGTTN